MALFRHVSSQFEVARSAQQIALDMKLTRSTVFHRLVELEKLGLVQLLGRSKQNCYGLLPPWSIGGTGEPRANDWVRDVSRHCTAIASGQLYQREAIGPKQLHQREAIAPEQLHQPNTIAPEQLRQPDIIGPEQLYQPNTIAPEQLHQPDTIGPEQLHQPDTIGPGQLHQPGTIGPGQLHQRDAIQSDMHQPDAIGPRQLHQRNTIVAPSSLSYTMTSPMNSLELKNHKESREGMPSASSQPDRTTAESLVRKLQEYLVSKNALPARERTVWCAKQLKIARNLQQSWPISELSAGLDWALNNEWWQSKMITLGTLTRVMPQFKVEEGRQIEQVHVPARGHGHTDRPRLLTAEQIAREAATDPYVLPQHRPAPRL